VFLRGEPPVANGLAEQRHDPLAVGVGGAEVTRGASGRHVSKISRLAGLFTSEQR
jgi:hypothetical protein